MSSLSPVAQRIREARVKTGLSQKSLGIAAGIDEFSASPRINQYERGKHAPDFSMVERLAKILDVPVAYFYAKEDWLAETICFLGKLPESSRENVIERMERLFK
ncbi:MAG: helix-turn-helix transcriptional regulator [Mariprofundus sp.]|nr:helix-turn-helix transcriptional regulator [Mariprofundus sp.]